MTIAEREVCTVMAAVLHAHHTLADLGLLITVVAIVAIGAASLLGIEIQMLALVVAIFVVAFGTIERYFALRIRLDERLFSALGDGRLTSVAKLDEALLRLDLISKDRTERTLYERLKGAAGLCWKHRTLVVIQYVTAIVFVMLQTF